MNDRASGVSEMTSLIAGLLVRAVGISVGAATLAVSIALVLS